MAIERKGQGSAIKAVILKRKLSGGGGGGRRWGRHFRH